MDSHRSALTLLVPGDSVLQVADVKQQLNLDFDDSDWDDWITQRITDAQNYVEGGDGRTGRALLTQQWRLTLPGFIDHLCFPVSGYDYGGGGYATPSHNGKYFGEIRIPLPPLQSIDSVEYLDINGVVQTVSSSIYRTIDGGGSASSIIPTPGQCWPSPVLIAPDAVRIEFTAGYESVDALNQRRPKDRLAMLLLIAHWFQNREGVTDGRINQPFEVPFGIDALLGSFVPAV